MTGGGRGRGVGNYVIRCNCEKNELDNLELRAAGWARYGIIMNTLKKDNADGLLSYLEVVQRVHLHNRSNGIERQGDVDVLVRH